MKINQNILINFLSTIKPYIQLMRLDKPVGIYLVLWPSLWALWLASDGFPPLNILLVFISGAVLMRSAGCIINDYADRDFDGHIARTQNRPLITGQVKSKHALILFIGICLLSFSLVLFLNNFTIFLSLIALVLAIIYPFTKRFTYWPQAFLGLAFAWAIPMAFAAIQNELIWQLWIIFFATLCWAIIYDTAYALVDMDDDIKIGVKSTAIGFGKFVNEVIALFQIIMLLLLLWVGVLFELHEFYYISLIMVGIGFVYHQVLLRKKNSKLAFKVFLQNHWFGFIILIGIVVDKMM